jgi:general secretion pathway protein D
VLIKDGGWLVLGGLIQDSVTNTESQVPLLGSIPILGELFRTRNTQKTKSNFLIFLQPHILRTDDQAADETDAKYNYVRDQQNILNHDKKIIPFQPFAPADPLPSIYDGRTATGVLSPDADTPAGTLNKHRHDRTKQPSTPDASATTPAPEPTPQPPPDSTPFTPAPTQPTTSPNDAQDAGAAR